MSVDVKRKSDRRELCQRFDHPDIQLSAACDFDLIEACDAMIAQIETQALNQARHHNEKHLDSPMRIPGVGNVLALTVLYEMHKADRFRAVQDFCSYARVVRVERSFDGKPTKDGNPNIGNPYLKRALGEIAIHAVQHSEAIGQYYEKLKNKFGQSKAFQRLSHKFGIAIYFMTKNNLEFDGAAFGRPFRPG